MMDAPIVHIGKVIRNAVAFNTQQWQGARPDVDHLLDAVAELFELLEQRRISYALAGGIALLKYIRGRNTEDIDLILSVSSLKKLPEIVVTHRDVYFTRGNYKGIQVGVLLTKNPLFDHVKKHHVVTQDFFGANHSFCDSPWTYSAQTLCIAFDVPPGRFCSRRIVRE